MTRNEKERLECLMKHGALHGIDTGRLDGKCEDVIPLEDAIAIIRKIYEESKYREWVLQKVRDKE